MSLHSASKTIQEVLKNYDQLLEDVIDDASTTDFLQSFICRFLVESGNSESNLIAQSGIIQFVEDNSILRKVTSVPTQKGILAASIIATVLESTSSTNLSQKICFKAFKSLEDCLPHIQENLSYLPVCLQLYKVIMVKTEIDADRASWESVLDICLCSNSLFARREAVACILDLNGSLPKTTEGSFAKKLEKLSSVITDENQSPKPILVSQILDIFFQLIKQSFKCDSKSKCIKRITEQFIVKLAKIDAKKFSNQDFDIVCKIIVLICCTVFPERADMEKDLILKTKLDSKLLCRFYMATFCIHENGNSAPAEKSRSVTEFRQSIFNLQLDPLFNILQHLDQAKPEVTDWTSELLQQSQHLRAQLHLKEEFSGLNCFRLNYDSTEKLVQSSMEVACIKILNQFIPVIAKDSEVKEQMKILSYFSFVILKYLQDSAQLFKCEAKLGAAALNLLQRLHQHCVDIFPQGPNIRQSMLTCLLPTMTCDARIKERKIKLFNSFLSSSQNDVQFHNQIMDTIFPHIEKFLYDVNWEVRDSALELLRGAVTSTNETNLDCARKWYEKMNLFSCIIDATADQETFVRYSAISCVVAMATSPHYQQILNEVSVDSIFGNLCGGVKKSTERVLQLACLDSLQQLYRANRIREPLVESHLIPLLCGCLFDSDIEMGVETIAFVDLILYSKLDKDADAETKQHIFNWAHDNGLVCCIIEACHTTVDRVKKEALRTAQFLYRLTAPTPHSSKCPKT